MLNSSVHRHTFTSTKTLNHCYTTVKNCHKAVTLFPFEKSDHAAILLMPKYKQHGPMVGWTNQWPLYRIHSSEDINMFTVAVVGFKEKLADDTFHKTMKRLSGAMVRK